MRRTVPLLDEDWHPYAEAVYINPETAGFCSDYLLHSV
jgi:hypothetical protein